MLNDKRIGILGGGQLGLMLLQAAIDLNLNVKILDNSDAPCRAIAPQFIEGSIQDYDAVYRFGQEVDVLTIEIEKVNVEALEALEREGKKVFPQPHVIRLIQDKRTQKQFYHDNGLPTADFILTENREEVRLHTDFLPAFHKLGRDGYDGKGVQRIASAVDFDKAFDAPGLLEKAVDFEKELAVIVARNESGEVATFPTVEMVFHPEANLVEYLFAPAEITPAIEKKAEELAKKTAQAIGIVGLLAVEMFLTKEGQVLINEVAPRPHNSGHHTIRANFTSQFEQHWRAILDFPLGDTTAYTPAAMVNLLGEAGHTGPAYYEGMETLLATHGVFPFLYGKKITKPFRKMGHITVTDSNIEKLKEKAEWVKGVLKVITK
ncbi:MAG: 5-(carboxyamino)imidazole ribonucleotide synthase [Spirosomataceae bacterium]